MPNTREKLIELLYNFYLDYNGYICDGCGTRVAERECATIADHLIANGVTVQKWIPVTERLPDRWQNVLSVSKYGKHCVDYVFTDGSWWSDREVTHWMPLPGPPKGE